MAVEHFSCTAYATTCRKELFITNSLAICIFAVDVIFSIVLFFFLLYFLFFLEGCVLDHKPLSVLYLPYNIFLCWIICHSGLLYSE